MEAEQPLSNDSFDEEDTAVIPVLRDVFPGVQVTGDPQAESSTILFTRDADLIAEENLHAMRQALAPFFIESQHQLTVDCSQVTTFTSTFIGLLTIFNTRGPKKCTLLHPPKGAFRDAVFTTKIIELFRTESDDEKEPLAKTK